MQYSSAKKRQFLFSSKECYKLWIQFSATKQNQVNCSEERISTETKIALERMKYCSPALKLSKQYNRHYETYLKCLSNLSIEYDHSFQPTAKAEKLGKCKSCPSFYFKFKTGRRRYLKFHRWQKSTLPKDIKRAASSKILYQQQWSSKI